MRTWQESCPLLTVKSHNKSICLSSSYSLKGQHCMQIDKSGHQSSGVRGQAPSARLPAILLEPWHCRHQSSRFLGRSRLEHPSPLRFWTCILLNSSQNSVRLHHLWYDGQTGSAEESVLLVPAASHIHTVHFGNIIHCRVWLLPPGRWFWFEA